MKFIRKDVADELGFAARRGVKSNTEELNKKLSLFNNDLGKTISEHAEYIYSNLIADETGLLSGDQMGENDVRSLIIDALLKVNSPLDAKRMARGVSEVAQKEMEGYAREAEYAEQEMREEVYGAADDLSGMGIPELTDGEQSDEVMFREGEVGGASNVLSISSVVDNSGSRFYSFDGNIDLWSLPDFLFEEIGREAAPIRLTERNVAHIIDRHGDQVGRTDADVFDFVSSIFGSYTSVRKEGRTLFVTVENRETGKAALIKLYPSESGDYYNVETAGYYREDGLRKKELLWNESEPRLADAETANTLTGLSHKSAGNAIDTVSQSSSSDGHISTSAPIADATYNQSSAAKIIEGFENPKGSVEKNVIDDDLSALRTAEKDTDPSPSEAQKRAGNYKKGHVKILGYDVSIETPKGALREGVDKNGNRWSIVANNSYGYIKGTTGMDGEQIDVYINDVPVGSTVYVIDQVDPETGLFDEHKVMFGFSSMEEAADAYNKNYTDGWKGLGSISEADLESFDTWLKESNRKTKPFAEYKSNKKRKGVSDAVDGDVLFRQAAEGETVRAPSLQGIKERTIADGTFMRAPNGEPTRLTERQWLQVRTTAFKEWFGDWEKAARVEKLRRSAPVEISGEEYVGKYELDRKSAQRYVLDNLRGEYVVEDTGDVIVLGKIGAKKVTSHSMGNRAHLLSIAHIPEIIQNSIFITEEPSEKDGAEFDSYRYYAVGLNVEGVPYTAKLVVGIKEGVKYYDHSLTEIEKGVLIDKINARTKHDPDNKDTLSEYKDTKLLSILQTNSSKVVDGNGEPMVVYHGTGSDFTVFDTMRTSLTGVGSFFSTDYNVAELYSRKGKIGRIVEVFLTVRNPFNYDNDFQFRKLIDESSVAELTDRKDQLENEYSILRRDYDGEVRYEGGRLTRVIVFSPNQIKSATDNIGSFDSMNDDIRFREDKTLYGIHNLSEKSLEHVFKMGGIANPSVAIVNSEIGSFDKFGDISLIAPSSLIEKRSGKSAGTWLADAYTPRYPRVDYSFNKDAIVRLNKEISSLISDNALAKRVSDIIVQKIEYGGLRELGYGGAEVLFLAQKGIDSNQMYDDKFDEDVRREFVDNGFGDLDPNRLNDVNAEIKKHLTDLYLRTIDPSKIERMSHLVDDNGIMRGRILSDFVRSMKEGIDNDGMVDVDETVLFSKNYVIDNDLLSEYEEFANRIYEKISPTERLFKGYSNSGSRQYRPHTLEEVSRMMKSEGRAGSESFNYGMGSTRSVITPMVKTLKQIRSEKSRIVSEDQFQKIKEQLEYEYEKLSSLFSRDRFDNYKYDRMTETLLQSDKKGYAKSNYDIDLSDENVDELSVFADLLREMPSEYFETKFERPVMLNEFVGAVVPKGMKEENKDALRRVGLVVVEYEDVGRKDAIDRLTNSIDGVLFRKSSISNEVKSNVDLFGVSSKYYQETERLFGHVLDVLHSSKSESSVVALMSSIDSAMSAYGSYYSELLSVEKNADVKYPLGDERTRVDSRIDYLKRLSSNPRMSVEESNVLLESLQERADRRILSGYRKRDAEMKAESAVKFGDTFGVRVNVVSDLDRDVRSEGLRNALRRNRGKGYFDPKTGEVYVVVDNNCDVEDVEKTVLHEVLAHKGLRELFGERFDTFLDNVYANARKEIRDEIDRDTESRMRSGNKAINENRRVATEEYMARLAEQGFTSKEDQGFWDKVREFFVEMLAQVGIKLNYTLTNNDLRYILWKSGENLKKGVSVRSQVDAKAARIEKLRRGASVEITGEEYKGKYELNPKSASRYILSELRGEYVNKDTGSIIRISRKGAEKVTKHDSESNAHLMSIVAIPQLIENSIFIDEVGNEKQKNGFTSYRYYVCGLKIGSVDYTVKLAVGVLNGETYYDHSLTEIEKADLLKGIDSINTEFANKEINLSDYKDKRLLSLLQTNSLKSESVDDSKGDAAGHVSTGGDGDVLFAGDLIRDYGMQRRTGVRAFDEGYNGFELFRLPEAPRLPVISDAMDENGVFDVKKFEDLSKAYEENYLNWMSSTGEVIAGQGNELSDKMKEFESKGFKSYTRTIVDEDKSLFILQDWVEQVGGVVGDMENMHEAKNLSESKGTELTTAFQNNQMKRLTDSYNAIIKTKGLSSIADVSVSDRVSQQTRKIGLYLQALDIIEAEDLGLVGRGRKGFEALTGVTVENYVSDFEQSIHRAATLKKRDGANLLKELTDSVKAVNQYGLDVMLEFGLISRDEHKTYSDRQHYVPQRGWDERSRMDEVEGYVSSSYGSSYNGAIKQAKGRESLGEDPLAYMQSIVESAILSGVKNWYKQYAYRFVLENRGIGEVSGVFNLDKSYYVNTGERNQDGESIFEVSYVRPSASLFEADKNTRELISEKRKELAKASRETTQAASVRDGGVRVVSVEGGRFKNFAEAKAWAKDNIVRVYSDVETGGKGEISISGSSIEKFLSRSSASKSADVDVHLSALSVLPSIIKESVVGEVHGDYKKGEDGVRDAKNGSSEGVEIERLYGGLEISGKMYRVKTTLKRFLNPNTTDKVYSYEVTKIELLAGQHGDAVQNTASPRNSNNSISIANLLKGVEKSYENGKKLLDDVSELNRLNGWDDVRKRLSDEIFELEQQLNVKSRHHGDTKGMLTNDEQRQHYVEVYVDGGKVRLYFANPRVANTLNKNTENSKALKYISAASRYYSAMRTHFDYVFAGRNLIKDVQFAGSVLFVEEGGKAVRLFWKNLLSKQVFAGALLHVMGNTRSGEFLKDRLFGMNGPKSSKVAKTVKMFFEDGASTGYSYLQDIDDLRIRLEKSIGANWVERSGKDFFNELSSIAGSISEFSELLTRLAVYKTALDLGKSRHQAAVMAKDTTVNFNRRGSMTRWFSSIYAFFGPTVQGIVKGHSLWKKSPKKMALLVGMNFAMGFISSVFMSGGDDEEDDRNYSPYHYLNNWILGAGFFLPMPHYFKMFGALGAAAGLAFRGKMSLGELAYWVTKSAVDEYSIKKLSEFVGYDEVVMGGLYFDSAGGSREFTPSVLQFITDLNSNRNFMGSKIYREGYGEQGKFRNQYSLAKERDSEFSKAVSRWLLKVGGGDPNLKTKVLIDGGVVGDFFDVNTSKLDYKIGEITGSAGKSFLDLYTVGVAICTWEMEPMKSTRMYKSLIKSADKQKDTDGMCYELQKYVSKYSSLSTSLKAVSPNDKSYVKDLSALGKSKEYNLSLKIKSLLDKRMKLQKAIDKTTDPGKIKQYGKDQKELEKGIEDYHKRVFDVEGVDYYKEWFGKK